MRLVCLIESGSSGGGGSRGSRGGWCGIRSCLCLLGAQTNTSSDGIKLIGQHIGKSPAINGDQSHVTNGKRTLMIILMLGMSVFGEYVWLCGCLCVKLGIEWCHGLEEGEWGLLLLVANHFP